MSPEEYLRFVQTVEHKWEYVDGTAYLMSGGPPTHAALSFRVASALDQAIAGAHDCRVHTSDLSVQANRRYYFPDVTVICGPVETGSGSLAAQNPALVVEVLSPSTQRVDRGEKLAAYLQIPSVRVVLLVSSTERRIETVRPDGTRTTHRPKENATVSLPEFGIEIELAAFYERVELDAG